MFVLAVFGALWAVSLVKGDAQVGVFELLHVVVDDLEALLRHRFLLLGVPSS